MSTKKRKNRTYIVKVVSKKRSSKVVPGHRKARAGDRIVWRPGATAVTLLFPDRKLFGRHSFSIRKRGSGRLRLGNVRPRKYPYAVYCRATNSFASGGTSPTIIIE